MESQQGQQTKVQAEEEVILRINLAISEIHKLGIQYGPSEACKVTTRRLESARACWEKNVCSSS